MVIYNSDNLNFSSSFSIGHKNLYPIPISANRFPCFLFWPSNLTLLAGQLEHPSTVDLVVGLADESSVTS